MRPTKSILLLVMYIAVGHTYPSIQRSQHKTSKDNSKHDSQKSNINSTEIHHAPKEYQSIYVRFAPQIPETPPWQPPDGPAAPRTKRSTNPSMHPIKQSVCESVSNWVEKTTAEGMWGNTLTVAQKIDISGTRVHQYFYETRCVEEHCQCLGIDTTRYTSKCESQHIWAYAKVTDSYGTEGWNLIKLRGGCGCLITAKVEERYESLWNDLR